MSARFRGPRLLGTPFGWMVAVNVMGVNLIAPALPSYAAHYGVGIGVASSLLAGFALARMSFRLLAGKISDRRGSRLVCIAGGAVQAGGALLAAFAPAFGVLVVARLIQGVGSAMFGTSANRYLLVTTDKAELGRGTAGFQSAILLGNTLGPLVGGAVAEAFGIFAPFQLQAVLALGIVFASGRLLDDSGVQPQGDVREKPIRALLGLGGFKTIMVLAFGLFFIRAGATNVLVPTYADKVLALSPTLIGAIISLGSAVSLLFMAVAGRLADTLGRRPVALVGVFGTAVTVMLYGLADTTWEVAVVSGLGGIGVGLAAVALPTMIGDMAPLGSEGVASGVYRMGNDLGWVVGPLALGAMADGASLGPAFVVAGLPLLAGALLFVALPEERIGAAARE